MYWQGPERIESISQGFHVTGNGVCMLGLKFLELFCSFLKFRTLRIMGECNSRRIFRYGQ